MRRPSLVLVAGLAGASLLVGCGSTVSQQQALGAAGAADGLAAPGGAGSTGLGPVAAGSAGQGSSGAVTTASDATGAATGPAGTTAAGPGDPAAAAGTAGAPAAVAGPATGRGFTKSTVYLGVGTADDYNAFASSFGVKGVGYSGDPNQWLDAVVDDINRKGGLAGRRIVLVKHNYNTAQVLNDPAAANQAACTTWTQDHPVFAVLLAGLIVEDTLLGCLAHTSTALIYPGAGLDYPLHYQKTYDRFPLFFNLAQMVGERIDRIAIRRLTARRFFSPWDTAAGKPGTTAANPVKIGLIGFDDNDGTLQQANQRKELARNGLKADSAVQCPRPLSNKIQCSQSAVLRFRTDGITHVFGADLIFMQNAQSQGYHPRYFLQTSAAALAANAGKEQLTGSMGEGYVPVYDVAPSEYPGDPTPATSYCKAVMKAAGQVATDNSTLALQLSVCDEFYFLQAAVTRAGALSASGVRVGMEALGAGQQSALTFRSFLGPSEHTSAAVLRDLDYRPDLGRFVYADRTDHGDRT